MPYATALQRPCFSSSCHCALSELHSTGGASMSLLQQQLGKAAGSASEIRSFTSWLLPARLKGKTTLLSLAQESNYRMNKESLYR